MNEMIAKLYEKFNEKKKRSAVKYRISYIFSYWWNYLITNHSWFRWFCSCCYWEIEEEDTHYNNDGLALNNVHILLYIWLMYLR